ncbi:hypothetical protein [Streptomyces sp. NPDC058045]|uniref:hypothetical protein n=1 Tax=Streptomyces sp. NPDC058045 TaxID=3346311 RepID=UPI0036E5E156
MSDHTPDPERSFDLDMEFVAELPNGQAVAPIEQEGSFMWLVVEGHMTKQCLDEMSEHLQHIVRNGLWEQNWDNSPSAASG